MILKETIIRRLFEAKINPMLDLHGGKAELVEVKDDVAYIKFSGGCQGCAGARMTLQRYLTNAIKMVVPSIVDVVDVTDHSAGENPYYKPEDLDEPAEDN